MRISDWSSDVCSSDLSSATLWDAMATAKPLGPSRRISTCGLIGVPPSEAEQDLPAWHLRTPVLRSLHGGAGIPHRNRHRSDERRGGKAGVSTCRSRWSPYFKKTNKKLQERNKK